MNTSSCLVDFTDVTLAFEDANSKLLDVVSVADVDAMKRVDDHPWAIRFILTSIEIDRHLFFLFEINQFFWPQMTFI